MNKNVEKEIQIKETLKIPYSRRSLVAEFVPDTIKIPINLELKLSGRNLYVEGIMNYEDQQYKLGNYDSFDRAINKFIPDFCLPNFYGNTTSTEEFIVRVVGLSQDLRKNVQHLSNFNFYESVLPIFYEQANFLPKKLSLNLEIKRQHNSDFRKEFFAKSDESPEKIIDRVFNPKCDHEYLRTSFRKSGRNPFSYGSLKHKVFSANKELAIFYIEYLWGKKLSLATNGHTVAKTLAGLPNKRFGINCSDKAKELDKLTWISLQDAYNTLKAVGIKPASKLSRWQKIRNLELK